LGLAGNEFEQYHRQLIQELINNDDWIEEESQDFELLLYHNGVLTYKLPVCICCNFRIENRRASLTAEKQLIVAMSNNQFERLNDDHGKRGRNDVSLFTMTTISFAYPYNIKPNRFLVQVLHSDQIFNKMVRIQHRHLPLTGQEVFKVFCPVFFVDKFLLSDRYN